MDVLIILVHIHTPLNTPGRPSKSDMKLSVSTLKPPSIPEKENTKKCRIQNVRQYIRGMFSSCVSLSCRVSHDSRLLYISYILVYLVNIKQLTFPLHSWRPSQFLEFIRIPSIFLIYSPFPPAKTVQRIGHTHPFSLLDKSYESQGNI